MTPSIGQLVIIMVHKCRGCEYDSSTHKTDNSLFSINKSKQKTINNQSITMFLYRIKYIDYHYLNQKFDVPHNVFAVTL